MFGKLLILHILFYGYNFIKYLMLLYNYPCIISFLCNHYLVLQTMSASEEYYLKVRNKLDDLGYLQPLSFESVLLVDKILEDLLITKKNLNHYKNVAQQSVEVMYYVFKINVTFFILSNFIKSYVFLI